MDRLLLSRIIIRVFIGIVPTRFRDRVPADPSALLRRVVTMIAVVIKASSIRYQPLPPNRTNVYRRPGRGNNRAEWRVLNTRVHRAYVVRSTNSTTLPEPSSDDLIGLRHGTRVIGDGKQACPRARISRERGNGQIVPDRFQHGDEGCYLGMHTLKPCPLRRPISRSCHSN